MPVTTADGTVTGFGLASPRLMGERGQTRQMFGHAPASRPLPGTTIVAGRGFAGADFEEFLVGLELTLVRPARRDEHEPGIFRTGCASASRRSSGPCRTSPAWSHRRIRQGSLIAYDH